MSRLCRPCGSSRQSGRLAAREKRLLYRGLSFNHLLEKLRSHLRRDHPSYWIARGVVCQQDGLIRASALSREKCHHVMIHSSSRLLFLLSSSGDARYA